MKRIMTSAVVFAALMGAGAGAAVAEPGSIPGQSYVDTYAKRQDCQARGDRLQLRLWATSYSCVAGADGWELRAELNPRRLPGPIPWGSGHVPESMLGTMTSEECVAEGQRLLMQDKITEFSCGVAFIDYVLFVTWAPGSAPMR